MSGRSDEISKKFREEWFQFNSFLFFGMLCLLTLVLLMLKKNFVIDGLAAFEILNERGEGGIVNMLFGLQYVAIPIFYLWKFTITTTFLWISSFFFGYKLIFTRMWKLVMCMELIFIIPEFLKVVWFFGAGGDLDYWEVKAFYPFSILSFLNFEDVADRFHYPLKALNLFEIFYWYLLFFGIHSLANKRKKIASWITFTGYIIPFLIWLGFYMIIYKEGL